MIKDMSKPMINKSFFSAVLFVLVISFSCKYFTPKKELISFIDKQNGICTVRISVYDPQAFGLGWKEYTVESSIDGNWQEVMQVKHDDLIHFDKEHIVFINPKRIFVFLSDRYAVTADGGRTWRAFQIDNEKYIFCMIISVKFDNDGRGSMNLECPDNTHERLFTFNFGVDWKSL